MQTPIPFTMIEHSASSLLSMQLVSPLHLNDKIYMELANIILNN